MEFPSFHMHNRKPSLTDGLPRTILPQCHYDISYSPLKSWSVVFSWSEKGSSVSQNILDRESLGLPNFYTSQWSVHAQLYSAWSSDTAAAREYPVPLLQGSCGFIAVLKSTLPIVLSFEKLIQRAFPDSSASSGSAQPLPITNCNNRVGAANPWDKHRKICRFRIAS